MANWLNIAGGIGAGYTAGQRDLQLMDENRRREQEARFLETQRAHVLDQQAKEAALAQQLGLIRPTGTYQTGQPTYQGMTGGLDAQDIPRQTETVTQPDVTEQQAAAFLKSGLPQYATQAPNLYNVASQQRLNAMKLQREQDVEKVRKFVAQLPGLSLEDAARGAADIATGMGTHVNAAVTKTKDGEVVAHVYRGDAPGSPVVDVPISNKQQLADMLMASTSDENYFRVGKLQTERQAADAVTSNAASAAKKAQTDADTFNEQKRVKYFEALAAHQFASANQARAGAAAEGQRKELIAAQIKKMNAEAEQIENKMSDTDKAIYAKFKQDSAGADRAIVAAQNSGDPKQVVDAQKVKQIADLRTWKFAESRGMKIDPYEMAGVPSPEEHVQAVVANAAAKKVKLTPETIEASVAPMRVFGKEYANEVKRLLEDAATTKLGIKPNTDTKSWIQAPPGDPNKVSKALRQNLQTAGKQNANPALPAQGIRRPGEID